MEAKLKTAIRKWIRSKHKIGNDSYILISEVEGLNDCSEKDTLIMIFKTCQNERMQIYRIDKPLRAIKEEDVSFPILNKKPTAIRHITLNDLNLI